ncbi:hypothetical protein WA026_000105 [Henosepilachna vigintioctopunctata]|uniref:HMG box domain-containing protein n=1 Tax=Henosepilachna vigintioctopunctata TaxID=420089 RepID=A0AAW1V6H3_9CUCU
MSHDTQRDPNKGDDSRHVGVVTNNPFLNFMREFRARNRNLEVKEQLIKGAEQWRKMNDAQKQPYVELARQARRRRRGKKSSHSRRRRRRHHSRG